LIVVYELEDISPRVHLFQQGMFVIKWLSVPYSRFYEVVILEGTYAIGERKMPSVFLGIELRL
jgi:hypothetical protein